jgi:3-phenylpropionate/cinnamic acid dioxygenase small subunit
MTASLAATAPPTTLEELYAQVQLFYANHMQLLDDGKAEEWAQTFTEDGTFGAPNYPQPARGRAALAAGVRQTHAELLASGVRRRHWHGMVSVRRNDDGTLSVRCYALVFHTPRGEATQLHRTCVCQDTLVWEDGGWRVRDRVVTRDDL